MVRVPLNVLQATNEKSKTERNYNVEKKSQHALGIHWKQWFSFSVLVNSAKMGAK